MEIDSSQQIVDFGVIAEPGPPPGDVDDWFEAVPLPSSRRPTLLMPVEVGGFLGDPIVDHWLR